MAAVKAVWDDGKNKEVAMLSIATSRGADRLGSYPAEQLEAQLSWPGPVLTQEAGTYSWNRKPR
jgi:hypothetical protein